MSSVPPEDPHPELHGPRSRNWLWFFTALGFLAVAAIGINVAYNLTQQLGVETLHEAQARWKQRGPADYDLHLVKTLNAAAAEGEPKREEYDVEVRGGKVRDVRGPAGATVEPRLFPQFGMEGLFGYAGDFLEKDLAPNAARTFRAADFDARTGALLRFRRRVAATRERQEIVLTLKPVAPPK